MEKGDKLWLIPKSYNRVEKEPIEVVVSKVGKKYFELEGRYKERYFIDSLREDSTNYAGQCFYSLQEILDRRERSELNYAIRSFFTSFNSLKTNDISLSELRKIHSIIFKNK